jgi:heptosyltransferase-1
MEKILIVRLGAMGDIVHAVPAVSALRRENPDAQIGWIVERRWQELLDAKLVDRLHIADTKTWRKNPFVGRSGLVALRRELRAENYDTCFDVQGAVKSAALGWMSGAEVVGSDAPRETLAKVFYKRTIPISKPHVIEQAAEICGVRLGPREEAARALPTNAAAEEWRDAELQRRQITRFAILNPGAGWGAKRWPAERFGAVAKALREHGIASLINAAPDEMELARQAEAASEGAAAHIQCTITQLITLTRRAALFIGGDTGPMHLANLVGVPVVATFGPTDPARNGPYYKPNVVLRSAQSATSYSHSAALDSALMDISVAEVVAAAESLL